MIFLIVKIFDHSPVRRVLIDMRPSNVQVFHVNFIYVNVYPVDEHRHISAQVAQKDPGSSNTGADHWNRLIHRVLNILLYLQEGLLPLADFRHNVTLHQHGDVVQGRCNIWQLKESRETTRYEFIIDTRGIMFCRRKGVNTLNDRL